jgi:predicted DNA-binding protein
MPSSPRKRGRPRAGAHGEKVSDYPQLTVRLPLETRARLSTLSLLLAQPMWRIIDQAIEAYVRNLPPADQKILGPLVERLSRGDWPVTSHWSLEWDKLEKRKTARRRAPVRKERL